MGRDWDLNNFDPENRTETGLFIDGGGDIDSQIITQLKLFLWCQIAYKITQMCQMNPVAIDITINV